MPNDINALLNKITAEERVTGLMTAFQNLPKEEQVALMEWARSISIRLASYLERQTVIEAAGTNEPLDLPVPKIYVELALKIGTLRGIMTANTELVTGCEQAFRQIMGDNKIKNLEDFKNAVTLTLQLAKW